MCLDFSLVVSTERTLADKVRSFQEKCVNLEEALEKANNVSAVEIRALKRELDLSHEKNQGLTKAYDELKTEHENTIFAQEKELDKVKKEMAKQLRESE